MTGVTPSPSRATHVDGRDEAAGSSDMSVVRTDLGTVYGHVQWHKGTVPRKADKNLQKALQTWFNKDFAVKTISCDYFSLTDENWFELKITSSEKNKELLNAFDALPKELDLCVEGSEVKVQFQKKPPETHRSDRNIKTPENITKKETHAAPSDRSNGMVTSGRAGSGRAGGGATGNDDDEECSICIDTFTNKKTLSCNHAFCTDCLQRSVDSLGPTCPLCKHVFGKMTGDQPNGMMNDRTTKEKLPGFKDCGTIVIDYNIFSGTQSERHPNPGHTFYGTTRTAYLPDNKEGQEVLRLLRKAFDQKLIFTIGASRTSGVEDMVTWNDIHHKTNIYGGPEGFGYPDDGYMARVKEELKSKGIK